MHLAVLKNSGRALYAPRAGVPGGYEKPDVGAGARTAVSSLSQVSLA